MKKNLELFCSQYANSLFVVLSIALLFLVFESIDQKPMTQSAIGGVYTANSLPIATVDIAQVIAIGAVGLLVVGIIFAVQIKYETKAPEGTKISFFKSI